MRIEFLVRGKEAKRRCEKAELPEGVSSKTGVYKAEGVDLYLIDFVVEGSTLASAVKLADLRDVLVSDKSVRLLEDGPSVKFCENLYPLFVTFEKGLREVVAFALCAGGKKFDEKPVTQLEGFSFEQYSNLLFLDGPFQKSVQQLSETGYLTKDDLIERIASLEQRSMWSSLFQEDDMPSLRPNFGEIQSRRNDVMHCHQISSETFRSTKALLRVVNAEIDAYKLRVRKNADYPKEMEVGALEALHLAGTYCSAYQETFRKIAEALAPSMMKFVEVASTLASTADTSGVSRVLGTMPSMTYISEVVKESSKTILASSGFDSDALFQKMSAAALPYENEEDDVSIDTPDEAEQVPWV